MSQKNCVVYHKINKELEPLPSFHVAVDTIAAHIQLSVGIKFDITVLKFTRCCMVIGLNPVYGLCEPFGR